MRLGSLREGLNPGRTQPCSAVVNSEGDALSAENWMTETEKETSLLDAGFCVQLGFYNSEGWTIETDPGLSCGFAIA